MTKYIASFKKDSNGISIGDIKEKINISEFDALLINVKMTKDDKVVVHNDNKHNIIEHTLNEIKEIVKLDSNYKNIVTLEGALTLAKHDKPLLIKINCSECCEKLIDEVIKLVSKFENRTIYISMPSYEYLTNPYELSSNHKIGLYTKEAPDIKVLELPCSFFHIDKKIVDKKVIDSLIELNYDVIVGTFNNDDEIKKLEDSLKSTIKKIGIVKTIDTI